MNSPALRRLTRRIKNQLLHPLSRGDTTIGITITSSTSKITKITAKIKKRNETGWRLSWEEVNPHSKGDRGSRNKVLVLLTNSPLTNSRPPKSKARKRLVLHSIIRLDGRQVVRP